MTTTGANTAPDQASGAPVVLITGAAGMLGRDLCRVFAEGYRVLPADIAEVDIRREKETLDYILERGPGLIVHAAAYTAVDQAEKESVEAMAVNGRGTENVARAAAACGALMVYISTDYLFDGRKRSPYVEDDPPNPLSIYGLTKLAGEVAVRRHAPRHLIVRTAWLFGPGKTNFVREMARRAVGRIMVRVVDDQVGTPTYTPHLAGAVRRLCEAGAVGVVNAVNAGQCSWFELTREIYRLSEADPALVEKITTAELDRPARRPAFSVLSTARLIGLLGEGLPPWEEALKEYLLLRDAWA